MKELVVYSEACRAVAAAVSFDEVKEILSRAEAVRAYAMQANNRTLELDAAEIRIRAERRLGEMLLAFKKDKVFNSGRKTVDGAYRRPSRPANNTPRAEHIKLETLGIAQSLSSSAQVLARQSPEAFESAVAKWRTEPAANGRPRAPREFVKTLIKRERSIRQNRSAYWFKLIDGRPVGRMKVGQLRARAAACLAEARLLVAIADHSSAADSLAAVEDCISRSALSEIIDRITSEARQ